ncbi:MAG: hypothetical protein IJ057_13505 [Bacteroidales bacterium]|nr:hypothetical protein [Bacteroidales bacterium]
MTVVFFFLALIKVVQLLLVGAFAEGHQWCLTAFFIVTGLAALIDLVLGVTIIITNREIDRREP